MKRFAVALITGLLAIAAPAQAPKVDAQAEVAAVLFAASATQAALAKSADEKLKAQQVRIAQLAAELKAGDDRHRADMIAAQVSFVAELSARDREYAAQIAVFRGAVTDIVATPEGAQALERFNAGDEAAALSILDKLRASNDKMRAEKLRLEDAAEARRIARLSLEARLRGKVTIDTVIVRYEEVVRLDRGVVDDWLQLARLYLEAGRLGEARRAVDAMASVAHDERERQRAFSERADVLSAQGDLSGARRAADEQLRLARKLRAAEPQDPDIQALYSHALVTFGEVARRQGDLRAAEGVYQEEVALMRRRAEAPTGTDGDRNALSGDLLHLADTLIARGELRAARSAIEENIALLAGVSAKAPDNVIWARNKIESMMWLTDVLTSLGQFDDARNVNTEIVTTASRLSQAEPGNARLQSDLALGHYKVASLARIEGQFAASRDSYQQARLLYEDLGAPGAGGVAVRQNHALVTLGIGETSLLLQDLPAARRACQKSVDGLRAMVALDATEASSGLALGQALYMMAAVLIADREFAAAHKVIAEGLAIDQALLKIDPKSSDAQTDLSTAYLRNGEVLIAEGNVKEARAPLERSLGLRNQLVAAQPGTASSMRGVAEVMHALLAVPGSTVDAPAFRAYLESMQGQGLLWPADRAWLDDPSGTAAH